MADHFIISLDLANVDWDEFFLQVGILLLFVAFLIDLAKLHRRGK